MAGNDTFTKITDFTKQNWLALGGAAVGGGIGQWVGSIFGPWGRVIVGAIGGIAGYVLGAKGQTTQTAQQVAQTAQQTTQAVSDKINGWTQQNMGGRTVDQIISDLGIQGQQAIDDFKQKLDELDGTPDGNIEMDKIIANKFSELQQAAQNAISR